MDWNMIYFTVEEHNNRWFYKLHIFCSGVSAILGSVYSTIFFLLGAVSLTPSQLKRLKDGHIFVRQNIGFSVCRTACDPASCESVRRRLGPVHARATTPSHRQ